ncbi:MAG TPA: FtsX-like permease family protein [Fimbriimonas sp.]|nr:FtsX-like permease family protein [Fimbriimonas sp.]
MSDQFKNVDPPLWVAWNQALASIRVRLLRQMVTTVGISLGIAFFCSVQIDRITEAATNPSGDDRLRWLVGTSLVMCLVGVTNSMLMSVAERYREIGTIKCLGASDGFIVKVFFIEAALLGALGSLIGALAGSGLMTVAQSLQGGHISARQFFGVVLIGTLIGIAMTIAAGIAPAMQAARMPAASALRVEV